MLLLKNIFMPQNKDILYAQNCSNILYWEINNYINTAITSKWLWTWWTNVFPKYYIIWFFPNQNKIEFSYENQWNETKYKTINFSWEFAKHIYCQTNSYQITMSGQIQNIKINKGLQNNNNEPIFQLHTDWIQEFTGKIEMKLCNLELTNCKLFAKYIIDTRTRHINYAKCMTFTGTNDTACQKRNQ